MSAPTTTTNFRVSIDFDLASAKWRENKKCTGGGTFKYICNYVLLEDNSRCQNVCVPRTTSNRKHHYCKKHSKI